MASRTQPFLGGVMHMSQALPGQAFKYDGSTFPNQICYAFKFTSTYEAIEKLILPPPLKVDRSQPPEVTVWYFSSSNSVGPGGKPVPYQGFQFRGSTEYNGVKGGAGWEYVDGLHGDKAAMDIMGSWSVQFGMMKRLADFSFVPIDGDRFEVTIKRHGTTLIKLAMSLGNEIDRSVIDQMAKNPDNPFSRATITVREIPNEDFSDFLDRSVLMSPTPETVHVRRAWEGKDVSIEFGHLEDDPLDELRPKDVGVGMVVNTEVTKEVFTRMTSLGKIQ
jgi:hypothetical protein